MDAPKKNNACVLVSGGIESSVLLWDALNRYDSVTPVYIQSRLRWEYAEIFCLKSFLRNLKSEKLKSLEVLDLVMSDLYAKHWSVTGAKVPGSKSKDREVYLPGRNIVLLSKTAVYASLHDIASIEIGVLKGNPFSDSTKLFFGKISAVLSSGLGKEMSVHAPFLKFKKEHVVLMGKRLPLELTFSCINPKGYEHCGDCNKCVERKKAFFAVGLLDKTKYKKQGI
jgi:7-cyano-7-deazaguanine synthase